MVKYLMKLLRWKNSFSADVRWAIEAYLKEIVAEKNLYIKEQETVKVL